MSNQQIQVTKKRQRDKNIEPSNKREKSEPHDESNATVNITDINKDCLEPIFKQLDLSDLLNVADSNQFLMSAARLAFVSKYGKTMLYMNATLSRQYRSIDYNCEQISIYDFQTCLKVLRCFGKSITKLTICNGLIPAVQRDKLDEYLQGYCAESVIELSYCGSNLNKLTKPFKKVQIFSADCHCVFPSFGTFGFGQ